MNKTFKISRSHWLHGEGPKESRLLRPRDGKMCCLGQVAMQCGLSKDDILDIPSPDSVRLKGKNQKFPHFLINAFGGSPCMTMKGFEAMAINDSTELDDEEREHRLEHTFLQEGYSLEFTE